MNNRQDFDILIIGSGISGLAAAIYLARKKFKIAVITRENKPEKTNTYWAQGGIVYPDASDAKGLSDDIQKASAGSSHQESIELINQRGREIIDDLLLDIAQTAFEKDEASLLKKTREAAHSEDRILYHGDFTGKSIQLSLLNAIEKKEEFQSIELFTGCTAVDLITPNHHGVSLQQRYEKNQVVGCYVFDQHQETVMKMMAKKVILATGGAGSLYLHHTNSEGTRGDGHAMAKRAGAFLTNMEFVQFHPTSFYSSSFNRKFLLTEAMRGEGAVLIDKDGKRFMEKYHPDMELAPRDIVSRSIVNEMLTKNNEHVYLDISFKSSDYIKRRFPTIYQYCLEHRVDITKNPIPVVPAAHYTCGGIKVDNYGRTNLSNLYAVGEVSCTGLHGANRLASTSLLEGLTWGYMAAEHIADHIQGETIYRGELIRDWELANQECDLDLVSQDLLSLKQTMWNYVGIIRSKERLVRARNMILELSDEIQKFYRHTKLNDELIGLRNAVDVSYQILKASQENKYSLGCFYRQS
jgi:L-aspartate oxidase